LPRSFLDLLSLTQLRRGRAASIPSGFRKYSHRKSPGSITAAPSKTGLAQITIATHPNTIAHRVFM
jgi:hypothetical protein